MKTNSRIITKILILFVILLVATTSGADASWEFAQFPVTELHYDFNLSLFGFNFTWEGSSQLPQRDNANQLIFLDRIINNEEIGVSNPTSPINKNLASRLDGNFFGIGKRDNYSSVDNNQNGVDELLGEETDILFVVQAVDGINNPNYTDMYIYTVDINLGLDGESVGLLFPRNYTKGSPTIELGQYIYPIFRTKLHRENKDSKWMAIESVRGMAVSAWYQENRQFTPESKQIPCFDINSWKAGTQGDSPDNAIWTFVGDNPTAEVDISGSSNEHTVYYKITPFSGSCKIETEISNCLLTVKDKSGIIVAQSQINSFGINELTFSSNETNQPYSLEVSGTGEIPIILTATEESSRRR